MSAGRGLFAAGQPAAVSEITVFPPPVLQAQHYRQSGVYPAWRFKECLFDTELKAAQDYDIFLRMVVEYGEPWKVEEATQILHINHGRCKSPRHRRNSRLLPFYRKHKDKFDRASRKYQLFTLYQIRNKRMNWRTLLTLLSVRNGKRLADGLRGNNVSGRLPR